MTVNKKPIMDLIIGGQSVLFSLFQNIFKENMDDVRKKELTYFALSTFTYVYLRLSTSSKQEREILTDSVALDVLIESLPYCGENISTKDAIPEYQKRYEIYDTLINETFTENGFDSDGCITLASQLYENVMGKSAGMKMIEMYTASPLLAQYVTDHIEFLNKNCFSA